MWKKKKEKKKNINTSKIHTHCPKCYLHNPLPHPAVNFTPLYVKLATEPKESDREVSENKGGCGFDAAGTAVVHTGAGSKEGGDSTSQEHIWVARRNFRRRVKILPQPYLPIIHYVHLPRFFSRLVPSSSSVPSTAVQSGGFHVCRPSALS